MLFKVYCDSKDARLPKRADEGAAGYDLSSCEEVIIPSGNRMLVSTGLRIQLPTWTYGRVAPRSGLSVKGVDIGAGVIDESYRGILKVLMINNTGSEFRVNIGDKIAQLIITPICCPNVTSVNSITDLDSSERGEGGFGSTGVK